MEIQDSVCKIASQEHCSVALPSDSIIKLVAIPSGSIIKEGHWSRKTAQKTAENEYIWNLFLPRILYVSMLKLLMMFN